MLLTGPPMDRQLGKHMQQTTHRAVAPRRPHTDRQQAPGLGLSAPQLAVLRKYAGRGPRYTSYPPANVWREDADQTLLLDGLHEQRHQPAADQSLYVHLPFCPSQCWFCACNVLITPRTDLQDPYLDGIEKELALLRPHLNGGQVRQLHWGGGSPSYLTPAQMRRLMALLRRTFHIADNAEIALEVDPRVTTPDHLATLRALGFNRLSMGVQDFDSGVQTAIHRKQSYELTADFVAQCRAHGFDSLNMDLIYGLPAQTPATFAQTVQAVLALAPDRVALYGYAHVPWLKPAQRRMDEASIPDSELRFQLFHHALEAFAARGYADIGLDHFAKPGDALALARQNGTLKRNFMGYTTQAGTDLIGVGLSSIGLVGGRFVQNERKLKSWQQLLAQGKLPVTRGHVLTPDDHLRGTIIAGLMCQGEVDFGQIGRQFQIEWRRVLAESLGKLAEAQRDGLLDWTGDVLTLSRLGRLLVRPVAMTFDAYLGGATAGRFSNI